MQYVEDLVYRLVADSSSLMADLTKVENTIRQSGEKCAQIYTESGIKKISKARDDALASSASKEEASVQRQVQSYLLAEERKTKKAVEESEKRAVKEIEREERVHARKQAMYEKLLRMQEINEQKSAEEYEAWWIEAIRTREIEEEKRAAKEQVRIDKEVQDYFAAEESKAAKEELLRQQAEAKEIARDERETLRWEKMIADKEQADEKARIKAEAAEEKRIAEEAALKERMREKELADELASVEKVKAAEKRAAEETHAYRKRLISMLSSLFVTIGVPMFYKGIVNEASDALEANNKLRAVFNDMVDDANAAAASLSRYYGVSTTGAKSMLSDTGNILTNFGIQQEVALQMSQQINELAVDLASFVNYSEGAEGAANALTKALLGEREAAKALGVAITENDIKDLAKSYNLSTTGLTRQQRALLTLEVMLKQTRNAQGDFERSSGDLENQLRILNGAFSDLKLVLGEQIIPVVISAVGATTDFFNSLEQADPVIHALLISLPALALAIKGVAVAYEFFDAVVKGSILTNKVVLALVGITAALTGLTLLLNNARNKSRDFAGTVDDLTKSMNRGNQLMKQRNALLKEGNELSNEASGALASQLDLQLQMNEAENVAYISLLGSQYQNKKEQIAELTDEYDEATLYVNAFSKALTSGIDDDIKALAAKKDLTDEELRQLRVMKGVRDRVYMTPGLAFTEFNAYLEEQAEAQAELNALTSEYETALKKLALQYKDNMPALENHRHLMGDELYNAVLDTIEGFKDLVLQGYDVADAISASEYVTQDWVSLLREVNKNLDGMNDSQLEEAGLFDRLSSEKIAQLEKERKTYDAYIDSRKAGIMVERGWRTEAEAEAADDIEWNKLKQDRIDMMEYYEQVELYIMKTYAEKKLEAQQDYVDSFRSFTDELASTNAEQLVIDLRDLREEYEDLVNTLSSSYGGLSEGMLGAYMLKADSILANNGEFTGAQREWYDNLSADRKAFFDDLVELTKAYNDRQDKLNQEYQDEISNANLEWDKKLLQLDEDSFENTLALLEMERQEEIRNAEKTDADVLRINKYYDAKMLEAAEDYYEKVKQARETYRGYQKDISFSGANELFTMWAFDYRDELAELEEAMQKELRLYEDNEEKKTQITEEYEKLRADLKKKYIMQSIDVSLDTVNDLATQLSSVLDSFAENRITAAESLLQEYEDLKDRVGQEAEDSGRELTRSEQDRLERETAMLEEQIEQQEKLVEEEKRKQFEMQKAFSIAEATITGIQAAINAYNSMSMIPYVGPALGATAAATTAAFVAAQIAAIAQEPMPSYAVGAYNIPQDQIAQVHKGELILPKPFADSFRENGGSLGGGDVVVNVYGATDDVSVESSESSDGSTRQLDIYLTSKVKTMVLRGELDSTLQSRYAISRRGRKG